MEDHLKICSLQEVECEFQQIGCAEKFRREEEEEHMKEKAQTHLTMMAATSVKMNQEFQARLQDLEEKIQERGFEEKYLAVAQERRFEEKFLAQKRGFEEKLQAQREEYAKLYKETVRKSEIELKKLRKRCYGRRSFMMENFSEEKERNCISDWKSPPMYTHAYGYKFCIGIDANGYDDHRGKSMYVDLWSMKGEHDDELTWPVTVSVTIKLINNTGRDRDRVVTKEFTWHKPKLEVKSEGGFRGSRGFISHKLLHTPGYLTEDDSLNFKITDITMEQDFFQNACTSM